MLVITASAVWAQGPSDEVVIRNLTQKYFDTREAQEPASLEALLTPDVDQLVSTGEWRRGRVNVVQGGTCEFAQRAGQENARGGIDPLRIAGCGHL